MIYHMDGHFIRVKSRYIYKRDDRQGIKRKRYQRSPTNNNKKTQNFLTQVDIIQHLFFFCCWKVVSFSQLYLTNLLVILNRTLGMVDDALKENVYVCEVSSSRSP